MCVAQKSAQGVMMDVMRNHDSQTKSAEKSHGLQIIRNCGIVVRRRCHSVWTTGKESNHSSENNPDGEQWDVFAFPATLTSLGCKMWLFSIRKIPKNILQPYIAYICI
jgi:hypothetical protein